MFYSGGRVGIYFGDFKDLSRDLPVLQPTILVCVPRILNRIYHRVSRWIDFNERFHCNQNFTLFPFYNCAQVISKVKGNWIKSRVLDVALKSKNPDMVFKYALLRVFSFYNPEYFPQWCHQKLHLGQVSLQNCQTIVGRKFEATYQWL